MIKVSVVVPVYNVEKYLRECLNSLVNQTLKDIEIICVNDGSTDNSLEILKEYQQVDNRIKIISKNNSGYGHTMNIGLDYAQGEYIGIVEPDDYVKLDMYEKLYNKAHEFDLDLIKADFYRFTGNKDDLHLKYNHLSHDAKYYNRVLRPYDDLKVFRFIMNTWSGIYKREFLNRYHIRHNETPGASFQDNGFWFQTFCWAERVYFLNEPFYMNRRDNPNSSVHSKSKVYAASNEYAYIHEFLEKNPKLKEHYMFIFSVKKFHNYLFTIDRIGNEFTQEFVEFFSKDLKKSQELGELDQKYFTEYEWKTVQMIINTPEKYYKMICEKKYKNRNLLLKGLYALKEHGIIYVLRKIAEKY